MQFCRSSLASVQVLAWKRVVSRNLSVIPDTKVLDKRKKRKSTLDLGNLSNDEFVRLSLREAPGLARFPRTQDDSPSVMPASSPDAANDPVAVESITPPSLLVKPKRPSETDFFSLVQHAFDPGRTSEFDAKQMCGRCGSAFHSVFYFGYGLHNLISIRMRAARQERSLIVPLLDVNAATRWVT